MSQAAPLQIANSKPKQSDSSAFLLQRKCACGSNASVLTGECEACEGKSMLGLQTKLAISEPGDRYEQEADRVADAVVAGRPVGAIGGPPPGTAQRKRAQCEAADEMTLRRKPSTQHVRRHTADAAAIAVAHGARRSQPNSTPTSSRDLEEISQTCAFIRTGQRQRPRTVLMRELTRWL
jgi:hypothetical protein